MTPQIDFYIPIKNYILIGKGLRSDQQKNTYGGWNLLFIHSNVIMNINLQSKVFNICFLNKKSLAVEI